MTLLEKMAEVVCDGMCQEAGYPREAHLYDARLAVVNALTAILTPTLAMVNRGALQAFSGPQVEGDPLRIYPALMWREMLNFVIEERDGQRDYGDDAPSAERAGEGGPGGEVLRVDAGDGAGEPADRPLPGVQGREDGAEG